MVTFGRHIFLNFSNTLTVGVVGIDEPSVFNKKHVFCDGGLTFRIFEHSYRNLRIERKLIPKITP